MSIEKRIANFENVNWSSRTSERAVNFLKLRFGDVSESDEDIQRMISVLKEEYGNDPDEIERVIEDHLYVLALKRAGLCR